MSNEIEDPNCMTLEKFERAIEIWKNAPMPEYALACLHCGLMMNSQYNMIRHVADKHFPELGLKF